MEKRVAPAKRRASEPIEITEGPPAKALEGSNRQKVVDVDAEADSKIKLIFEDSREDTARRLLSSKAAEAWKQFGVSDRHGVVAPVFSLKTESSCGVGEFLDLLPLIDWCAEHGLRLVQLLPLGATAVGNAMFSSIGCCSLNPLLLSLRALPAAADCVAARPDVADALERLAALNVLPRIDWAQVSSLKLVWLRGYIDQRRDELFSDPAYRAYLEDNRTWLVGFALYCALDQHFSHKSWTEWPEEAKSVQQLDSSGKETAEFRSLVGKHQSEVDFMCMLQYLCHTQMSQVRRHADKRGVALKGDLPFLVSRDSADVWLNRDLFKTDAAAGAPPDVYSAAGQDWGLPPPNWEAMEQRDFDWWKQRLQVAARYFHAYRIDHIVGFFRVWSVPEGKLPVEGAYDPPQTARWIPQGEGILSHMLDWSSMLPIGEDLGTVPMAVRQALQRLGISGTKVWPPWERDWKAGTPAPFLPPGGFNADSLTTVSTHDSETLGQWWLSHAHDAKLLCDTMGWPYNAGESLSVERRKAILAEVHKASNSLLHINLLSEYLRLVPELNWAEDDLDRINIPGTTGPSNWSFRLKATMKEIAASDGLSTHVRDIVSRP